jgi:hypothetical protein
MVPQFNSLRDALTAGGVKNIEIVAVDVSQEFSSLRAGGISVPHVPLVLIKTPTSIIEYQGNRMATEIASEAAKVLAGGESVPATVPATVPETVAPPADALLGGSVETVEGGARTVGKMKRRSKGKRRPSPSQRKGYRSPHRYASGVDRSPSRVRKQHSVRRKSKKTGKVSRFMRFSARRSQKSINRSRSLRQLGLRLTGGEEVEGGHRVLKNHERYPSGVDRSPSRKRHLVADYHVRGHWSKTRSGKKIWVKPFDVMGRQTSRRSRSSITASRKKRGGLKPYRSRAIRGGDEPVIAGGEAPVEAVKGGAAPVEAPVAGGAAPEGGMMYRRRGGYYMGGGEVEGGEVEGGEIEGGKGKKRRSRSGSRTRWQRIMAAELKKHSPTKAGFAAASRAASKKYHA